jgi:phosphoenolpyruvate-protein kinase (PTS system EI component)
MGTPAVVGLGNITAEVNGGDMVIIDGNRGVVIVNPDTEQLAEHREFERKLVRLETELATLRELLERPGAFVAWSTATTAMVSAAARAAALPEINGSGRSGRR